MPHPPVLSVVDYAAWEKGYMPPAEHCLIDELSYRGAKVLLHTSCSREHEFWLVIKGKKPLKSEQRKMLMQIMSLWFETDDKLEQERDKTTEAAIATLEGEGGPAIPEAP